MGDNVLEDTIAGVYFCMVIPFVIVLAYNVFN